MVGESRRLGGQPPKAEGVCDHRGGPRFPREDDRPESVKVRMEAYQHSTGRVKVRDDCTAKCTPGRRDST